MKSEGVINDIEFDEMRGLEKKTNEGKKD